MPSLNSVKHKAQSQNNRDRALPPASPPFEPSKFPEFPKRLRPLRSNRSRLRSTRSNVTGDRDIAPVQPTEFNSSREGDRAGLPRRQPSNRPSSSRQREPLSAQERWEARVNNTSALAVVSKPSASSPSFSYLLLLYGVRFVILGIGLGAIAGTLIATIAPYRQIDRVQASISSPEEKEFDPLAAALSVPLGEEILPLKTKIEAIAQQNPRYDLGVFLLDLDTKAYVNWQGIKQFSAASTIKAPILVAFFQEIDARQVRLNETLIMDEESRVGEAGRMQYQPVGSKFSAKETVEKMIVVSDNTATNMIIKRLGGIEALNRRFLEWGLTSTTMRELLPDVSGTNLTSPVDLANVLVMVNQGKLVSLRSRDRLLNIMKQVENRQLLPQGLEPGASIAHKTGNIGSLIADAGLIDTPTGKRYIIVVMVKREYNDPQAQELIKQISRETYQYFNQRTPTPNTTIVPREERESVALKHSANIEGFRDR
ncbi:serine hydrolase [Spirulina sp. 06S082]|uniref:serine hydrolase n=1 Tax=Spirulina sp. 06S082 TaxID=3110248 RepID=UPI002B2064CC|nr:serine hydrolase [Spirulina sp. 06S082]MEA5471024.1 serine hydrolase [Spirulina sp. 06S082]